MHEMMKRLGDLELEASKNKVEVVLLRQRVAEQETFCSFMISSGQIPEEALAAPSSTVIKRKKV